MDSIPYSEFSPFFSTWVLGCVWQISRYTPTHSNQIRIKILQVKELTLFFGEWETQNHSKRSADLWDPFTQGAVIPNFEGNARLNRLQLISCMHVCLWKFCNIYRSLVSSEWINVWIGDKHFGLTSLSVFHWNSAPKRPSRFHLLVVSVLSGHLL